MKVSLLRKKWIALVFFAVTVLVPSAGLMAWTGHPLVSYPVLSTIPKVRDAQPVAVESIEAFLMAEGQKLEGMLAEEEMWARKHLQWYAPLPDALAFKAAGSPDEIRLNFCRALRINPRLTYSLFLQLMPGEESKGRPMPSPGDITFLRDTSNLAHMTYP